MLSRSPSAPAGGGSEDIYVQKSASSPEQKDSPSAATATPDGVTIVSRQRRSTFSKVKRSITKGPRLLGRRIKHFLKDDLYIDVRYQKAPPKAVAKELAALEILSVYHRWLRGVQALLAIAVFILSLLSFGKSAVLVNSTIFVVSQAATLVICKTYQIKAQFSGLTNVLFEGRNIFTSPYFLHMAAEIVLWNIQTPPFVLFGKDFFSLLNYFIFIRLYAVVVYLNNAMYVYRTFCRTMSAISDLPLSTSFLIRTGLIHNKARVVMAVTLCTWLTIGFLFFGTTQNISLGDAMWFSFQSLATLGYGDITPSTLGGRAVTFIAWIASNIIMAFLITTMYGLLQASERSHNMQTLMTCHDLVHTLRSRSARVIQLAWRLHKARKVQAHAPSFKHKVYTLALSWVLTHMIAALRRTRQQLNNAKRTLQETNIHPLTGLSAYQYNAYLHATHQAARKLQRIKDVDRVHLALQHRDLPASSLSRRDIESIIFLPDDSLEHIDMELPMDPKVSSRPSTEFVAEKAQWRDRVAQLEQKCSRLAELLDAMSAVTATQPPSMAVSHV